MPSSLVRGFTVHFRAARLIVRDSEVRRLASRPLLVNILLMVAGLPLGIWGAIQLSGMLVGGDGVVATLLRTFLQILAAAVGVFLSFFLLLLLGSAIAGPLNSKLSLAVEQKSVARRFLLAIPPSCKMLPAAWRLRLGGC
ncbi:MAG: Etoposide-induced protein 2.4 (EI24) [Chlorobi bacterium OLB7]|nr:MAG: Etoposide-induced protein 2.4 (EI24) [Chlorobi bacterium OLB7]